MEISSPSPCGGGLGGGGSPLHALEPDNFKNSLDIFNYFVVPKSQYRKSIGSQTVISVNVILWFICMLSTVKLDDNLLLKGDEVNNIRFNWLLPAEFDPFKLTVSQSAPQEKFNSSSVIS